MSVDPAFMPHPDLHLAIDLLEQAEAQSIALPESLPEHGIGEQQTLRQLAYPVLQQGARLDLPATLAHMDPPTPWISWAMSLWNARMNQNLLHPSTAPFAREAERLIMDWLCPLYGMQCGQFCAGSTLANLNGLWAARDAGGVKQIVVSEAAHISIDKAARILNLPLLKIPLDADGRIDRTQIPDLEHSCLVLIAGTTNSGAIDPLQTLAGQARWTHVDAAWGGPLRLSHTYQHLLNGIEQADSISISAHKWLFQPKDSALILYRNPEAVAEALSFSAAYLAQANFGVQGSRGAAAIPLLATLLAWGRVGLAERIERLMLLAQQLAEFVSHHPQLKLYQSPQSGIVLMQPRHHSSAQLLAQLRPEIFSSCFQHGQQWVRSVPANPSAQLDVVLEELQQGLARL